MAKKRKNSSTSKETTIKLSRWAFLYFFGYHWWSTFKKFILWVLIIMVGATAISLIRSAKIFGMADQDIARAFLSPLPRVMAVFLVAISLYSLLRAIISAFTTNYTFTPKGVVIQAGWPTRRTTIVDYGHIQKMTIVSNPFDRFLKSSYVQLDLIGGAPGVLLEAVDSKVAEDIQEKLSAPSNYLIAATSSALTDSDPSTKNNPNPMSASSSKKTTKPANKKPSSSRATSKKPHTRKKNYKKIASTH